MKKIILFVGILILLWACSQKKDMEISNDKTLNKTGENLVLNKSILSKKLVLSDYDKLIIALAVKKNDKSICDNLVKNRQICKNTVDKEYKFYKIKECDKLNFLKQKCEDEVNFEKRNCNKIKNELLKRQCNIMKVYDEAIKNQDKSLCNKLPRPQKIKCFQNVLTK